MLIKKNFYLLFVVFAVYLNSCKKDSDFEFPQAVQTDNSKFFTTSEIENILLDGIGSSSFKRIIGGVDYDGFHGVECATDGGFIFCGTTMNEGATKGDLLVYKTKSNGEKEWLKRYSGDFSDEGLGIVKLVDGGFLICGTTDLEADNYNYKIPYISNYDGLVLKIDDFGNEVWRKTFRYNCCNKFRTAKQLLDKGFIIGVWSPNNGYAVKLDEMGNEEWKIKTGKSDGYNYATASPDSFIYVFNPSAEMILKLNYSADTIWYKNYDFLEQSSVAEMGFLSDGSFIVCGKKDYHGYISLIDQSGEEIWAKEYSSQEIDAIIGIKQTISGDFVAIGSCTINGKTRACLLKTDSDGNLLWKKVFSIKNYNMFSDIEIANDGGYIMSGYTYSDCFVVKTDTEGF